jgi:cysteine desulfurase/selenocysteine lyase
VTPARAPVAAAFDAARLRAEFPILAQQVNGKPLVYLDNAATTQKPVAVIEAVSSYYREINSNVHRGAHALSDRATSAFEGARDAVCGFINAPSREQVIWTRGTTESINLVAASFARSRLRAGDEILVSGLAHHSNIVPWQLAAEASVPIVPIGQTTRARSVTRACWASARDWWRWSTFQRDGHGAPGRAIIHTAHAAGVPMLLDSAQAVGHMAVDVQALG